MVNIVEHNVLSIFFRNKRYLGFERIGSNLKKNKKFVTVLEIHASEKERFRGRSFPFDDIFRLVFVYIHCIYT